MFKYLIVFALVSLTVYGQGSDCATAGDVTTCLNIMGCQWKYNKCEVLEYNPSMGPVATNWDTSVPSGVLTPAPNSCEAQTTQTKCQSKASCTWNTQYKYCITTQETLPPVPAGTLPGEACTTFETQATCASDPSCKWVSFGPPVVPGARNYFCVPGDYPSPGGLGPSPPMESPAPMPVGSSIPTTQVPTRPPMTPRPTMAPPTVKPTPAPTRPLECRYLATAAECSSLAKCAWDMRRAYCVEKASTQAPIPLRCNQLPVQAVCLSNTSCFWDATKNSCAELQNSCLYMTRQSLCIQRTDCAWNATSQKCNQKPRIVCTDLGQCSNHGKAALSTATSSCTCTCRNQWAGDSCSICPTKFGGVDCDQCAPGFTTYPLCNPPRNDTEDRAACNTRCSALGCKNYTIFVDAMGQNSCSCTQCPTTNPKGCAVANRSIFCSYPSTGCQKITSQTMNQCQIKNGTKSQIVECTTVGCGIPK